MNYWLAVLFLGASLGLHSIEENEEGAWLLKDGSIEYILLFKDSYYTYSVFDKENKRFNSTEGGTYKRNVKTDYLEVHIEFDTHNKERTGTNEFYGFSFLQGNLLLNKTGKEEKFTRIDDGTGQLVGNWRISARKQGDNMVEIIPGTRKTLKLLTGKRFQWMAIDPSVKGFFGTGGGTYTFENGKYIETIEFFSRDSTRVGASLSFDGVVEGGTWKHSGLSSRGDPIFEHWKREEN